ncbi:HMG-box [Cristinia sonorae]|uniref:HMG-box n=1 Tax=Cristinia sonorae TaxID=1940300 RepID=A0A8K0UWJ4_9AGAR|nr:HMG-box [Cristinia sonorae]
MANLPEGLAQFEYQKMQLIGSLGAVADTMRNCATIADQFAQLVSHVPYNPMIPNGQFPITAPHPVAPLPVTRGKRKASEDVEGRRAKKPKKPKDPNAPKRPASSYLLFQNEVRQELKAKNPTLPNNELLGLIAKMWKDMPKSERDEYETRQKAAKDQWVADKTAYNAALGASPETLATTVVDPSAVLAEEKAQAAALSFVPEESSDEEESSSASSRSSEGPGVPKKSHGGVASSSKHRLPENATNTTLS